MEKAVVLYDYRKIIRKDGTELILYNWNTEFDKATDMKDIMRKLLKSKGLNKESVKDFINFNIKKYSPFLFRDMEKAINTIKKHKRIVIFGDYDCDGICATTIMYIGLKQYGFDVSYDIPIRGQGYGVSVERINKYIIDDKPIIDCIITVDNGIGCAKECLYAKTHGIDFIVTDHHLPNMILPDCPIIDPYVDDYPCKYLCGALVALKFISALFNEKMEEQFSTSVYRELILIATIATISDCMKLQGENRVYVHEGLSYVPTCSNEGLKRILELLGKDKLTATDVAFGIGPMMNATGRMKTAYLGVELLLTDNIKEAEKLAKEIYELNEERKEITTKIANNLVIDETSDFIIIEVENVLPGILGIIANKLADKYQKPTFVVSGRGDNYSGSGRSVGTYSIFQCIQDNKDIMWGGGHAAAAGVGFKKVNLDLVRKRCSEHFNKWKEKHNEEDLKEGLTALCEVDFPLVTKRLISNINKLEPFGEGNAAPLFITRHCKVVKAKVVGKQKNTLQMTLEQNGTLIKVVGFQGMNERYHDEEYVDIIYQLGLNEWPKDVYNIQLILVDVQPNI